VSKKFDFCFLPSKKGVYFKDQTTTTVNRATFLLTLLGLPLLAIGQLPMTQPPKPGGLPTASPHIALPQPAIMTPVQVGVSTPSLKRPSVQNDPLYQQQMQRAQQDMAAYRERQAHLKEIIREVRQETNGNSSAIARPAIHYNLPPASLAGEEFFDAALDQLTPMLEGHQPASLKRAVFIAENAYFGNQMDYASYSQTLDNMVAHCQLALEQGGFDTTDPLAKLMILHKFMADTLRVNVPGQERPTITYPMQYDFEDFWGREDITKQMVSKLMTTTTGQCRSMPLLFLILAEQMGVDAHLALAPEHSYVKFQDKQSNWYNLELTNGKITTDEFIMQSGYIKAEALRQGLYMRPLSKQEAVAQCLNDLGLYYTHRYGYGPFISKVAETMETYLPDGLHTAFWQANYQSVLFNMCYRNTSNAVLPKPK
jgi:hypothetical protein